MLPSFVREYVLTAISGAPAILERLVEGVAPDDPIWDRRPNPARFTLREIIGHLADWNGVFLDRITRIRDEEAPRLRVRDPEEIGWEHGSFRAAPAASLARFRAGRAELVTVLRALEPDGWERTGNIVGHASANGSVSIEAWVMAIAGHDGYHLQQIAQWIKSGNE